MRRRHELPSERVTADLRRRIRDGEWHPGDQLPSVSDLAEHYGVSRATIQKVVHTLVGEGLLAVRHGWGTFVPE